MNGLAQGFVRLVVFSQVLNYRSARADQSSKRRTSKISRDLYIAAAWLATRPHINRKQRRSLQRSVILSCACSRWMVYGDLDRSPAFTRTACIGFNRF